MSESSLRRSLKAQGTSYQELLNQVRTKMAVEYLTTSKLKLDDISYPVGYNDLSNFRLGFRAWTGRPPRHYRVGGMDEASSLKTGDKLPGQSGRVKDKKATANSGDDV